MTTTAIKLVSELWVEPSPLQLPGDWHLRAFLNEECLSYVAWNSKTQEALFIDPKKNDLGSYLSVWDELSCYLCIGVIDTHTHADHISAASDLAKAVASPLMMHVLSPSARVNLRVSRDTQINTRAGLLSLIPTPGHTPDSLCVVWGPFCFTGDTVLYGDVGRDDLPGGSPEAHYESLQVLKKQLKADCLILPGHDNKGGRVSTWATQLTTNSSLTQDRASFVEESKAFDGTPPALLKKSLFENFK